MVFPFSVVVDFVCFTAPDNQVRKISGRVDGSKPPNAK